MRLAAERSVGARWTAPQLLRRQHTRFIRALADGPRTSRPRGAGGGRGASRSGSASVTTMHARFNGEVECKMPLARPDFFLYAFRSSSPTSLPSETPHRAACSNVRAGNACRNPCASCIFSAPQLEREQSPRRSSSQIPESYAANSNGFCSRRIPEFESHHPSQHLSS